jgi:hypothetical protein
MFNTEIIDGNFKIFEDKGHNYPPVTISYNRTVPVLLIPNTTKYVYLQSTTVYVPSSELGLSHPLPLQPKGGGGGHARLQARGWESPIPTT